jgi:hypothetical protein
MLSRAVSGGTVIIGEPGGRFEPVGVVEDCRFQRGGSPRSDRHWVDGVFVHRVPDA